MRTGPPKFDGPVIRSWGLTVSHHLDQIGLRLCEIEVPPRAPVPLHEHDLAHFCVLLEGASESGFRGRAIPYHRLLTVFNPVGIVHTVTVGCQGARVLTLEMTPAWSQRLEGLAALPDAPTAVPSDDGGCMARRLLRELRQPQPCSPLVLEGLTLELLVAASRATVAERPPPPWLARVLDRLHDELARPLTLGQLAGELGIDPTRLSASFRRHLGRSVGEYRRALQVQFVQDRLRDRRRADEPLVEIALAAGFADQAHCTRVFKAATGLTPGRYRAAAMAR
jgi:AraC family transcriptional regulator